MKNWKVISFVVVLLIAIAVAFTIGRKSDDVPQLTSQEKTQAQAVADAEKSADAADQAAVSARRAADSTRETAKSAEASADIAAESAKTAAKNVNNK